MPVSPSFEWLLGSILRSLYQTEYLRIIPRLADASRKNIALLERNLLHIATLESNIRSNASVLRFLQRITEIRSEELQSFESEQVSDRYALMLELARRLLIEAELKGKARKESLVASAESLWHLLVEDGSFQHELRPFLEVMSMGRENLKQSQTRTWATYFQRWKTKVYPLLVNELLPRVAVLRPLLRRALTPADEFPSLEAEYLAGVTNRTHRSVVRDVSIVHSHLSLLAEGNGFAGGIDAIGDACQRVFDSVCGFRAELCLAAADHDANVDHRRLSALANSLLRLRRTSLCEFRSMMEERISAALASRSSLNKAQFLESPEYRDDWFMFLPPDIIERAVSHVTTNLLDYGLFEESRVEVALSVTRNEEGEATVNARIRNSGATLRADATQGADGRRLNSMMQLFGGEFPTPSPCSVPGLDVEQAITSKLWSAEIDERLARG